MLFYTHVVIGIILFLSFGHLFAEANVVIFLLVVLLGSLLPDIDENGSKINQWSGIIGRIVSFFTKHRGVSHSIFFSALLFFIVKWFFGIYSWAFLIGYLGHIFADGITPMGVHIFYPFSNFKIKGPIKVGSFAEGVLFLGLVAWIIVELW